MDFQLVFLPTRQLSSHHSNKVTEKRRNMNPCQVEAATDREEYYNYS